MNLKVCNQSVETTVTLKIVGAFSSQGSKDNIYVPLSFWFLPGWITGVEQVITWVDNPIRKLWWNDEDMEACVLTTTNFRTGRFVLRSAYDLDAMRDCLEELNFSAVGILRKNRTTVILLDQSFVETAEGIRRQMTFMEFLFPVMLLLVAVIGFVISWLMTNGRRMEFAMMRGLGAGRARVFFSFFLEQAGLCLTGCLAAGVVLVAAGGGAASCLASLIFLACYLAGSALSILAVSKVGLMELLSERE